MQMRSITVYRNYGCKSLSYATGVLIGMSTAPGHPGPGPRLGLGLAGHDDPWRRIATSIKGAGGSTLSRRIKCHRLDASTCAAATLALFFRALSYVQCRKL